MKDSQEWNPHRGTGRTTAQMAAAPQGAAFVWCTNDMSYPRALARFLGRIDLKILPLCAIEHHQLRGLYASNVVVDHAAQLSARARYELAWLHDEAVPKKVLDNPALVRQAPPAAESRRAEEDMTWGTTDIDESQRGFPAWCKRALDALNALGPSDQAGGAAHPILVEADYAEIEKRILKHVMTPQPVITHAATSARDFDTSRYTKGGLVEGPGLGAVSPLDTSIMQRALELREEARSAARKSYAPVAAGVYRNGLGGAFVIEENGERRYIPREQEAVVIRARKQRLALLEQQDLLDAELGISHERTLMERFEASEHRRRAAYLAWRSGARGRHAGPVAEAMRNGGRVRHSPIYPHGAYGWSSEQAIDRVARARARFVDQEIGG